MLQYYGFNSNIENNYYPVEANGYPSYEYNSRSEFTLVAPEYVYGAIYTYKFVGWYEVTKSAKLKSSNAVWETGSRLNGRYDAVYEILPEVEFATDTSSASISVGASAEFDSTYDFTFGRVPVGKTSTIYANVQTGYQLQKFIIESADKTITIDMNTTSNDNYIELHPVYENGNITTKISWNRIKNDGEIQIVSDTLTNITRIKATTVKNANVSLAFSLYNSEFYDKLIYSKTINLSDTGYKSSLFDTPSYTLLSEKNNSGSFDLCAEYSKFHLLNNALDFRTEMFRFNKNLPNQGFTIQNPMLYYQSKTTRFIGWYIDGKLVSTDVTYFAHYSNVENVYPQTKVDASKDILIEARFSDRASASLVEDAVDETAGFTVIQIIDPTTEDIYATYSDAKSMREILLAKYGRYQAEIYTTFNGEHITTPSGFYNLIDLAGTTAKLYASSDGELRPDKFYVYDDEKQELSRITPAKRDNTRKYVEIEYANFAGKTVVVTYSMADTSDAGTNFTIMQTSNGKITSTSANGAIRATISVTERSGLNLNVSTEYAYLTDDGRYELLQGVAEFSTSTGNMVFTLSSVPNNFVGWYVNGEFASTDKEFNTYVADGDIIEARYYSDIRIFDIEAVKGNTRESVNLVALVENGYTNDKVLDNATVSGTGVTKNPYYIYSSSNGYINRVESYGGKNIRLYAPEELDGGDYLLQGFFYETEAGALVEIQSLETGSSSTGEILFNSSTLPSKVEHIYAVYGLATGLIVNVNTNGVNGILPNGIQGISHGIGITTDAIQKTYDFVMKLDDAFGYEVTGIGYVADGVDKGITPVKKTTSNGISTYSAKITLTGETNSVTFYAKNSLTKTISVYVSHYDTVQQVTAETFNLVGMTTLPEASPTSIYEYTIDQQSYTKVLKFVGWYLLDPNTGKTTLLAYDRLLTLNAEDENLDKYVLVKKYDGTGNNNLIPTMNVLSVSVDDKKATPQDILDIQLPGSGSAYPNATYEELGITLKTEGDLAILSSTVQESELGEKLSFIGWYKNGALLGTSQSLSYNITKGVPQSVEARFTTKTTTLFATVYSKDLDTGEYLEVTSTVQSLLATSSLIKNGRVNITQDALVSISLPKGQKIDVKKTKEENPNLDILVSGNDPDAKSASILISKLGIASLIDAEIDSYEIKVYLEDKLPEGHDTIIQEFGTNQGLGGVSITKKFTIDKTDDLSIQISTYNYKLETLIDPEAYTENYGYTINTYYFYYNPFLYNGDKAILNDSKATVCADPIPPRGEATVLAGTNLFTYTLSTDPDSITLKNLALCDSSDTTKKFTSSTKSPLVNTLVKTHTTLTAEYHSKANKTESDEYDFDQYAHIYSRIEDIAKDGTVTYYTTEHGQFNSNVNLYEFTNANIYNETDSTYTNKLDPSTFYSTVPGGATYFQKGAIQTYYIQALGDYVIKSVKFVNIATGEEIEATDEVDELFTGFFLTSSSKKHKEYTFYSNANDYYVYVTFKEVFSIEVQIKVNGDWLTETQNTELDCSVF